MNTALILVAGMLLVGTAAGQSVTSNGQHRRTLKVAPLPLPAPFAFPKDVADAARAARSAGRVDAFASELCSTFARKDLQGTREFRDTDGVELYPMFINFARAATVYPDVVDTLAAVLAKCDTMGGMSAEGVGYGMAYVYSKGLVESLGVTDMLNRIYVKAGGCKQISTILDVAAAVVKSRDVALDELHLAIGSHSKRLQGCTPRDAQQRFKAYSLKGDVSQVKPKGSLSLQTPPAGSPGRGSGSGARNGGFRPAAGSGGAALALERGRDTAGR